MPPLKLLNGAIPKNGPVFGRQEAANYLGVSLRQIDIFEETGRLFFFSMGKKLRKTTKGACDELIQQCVKAELDRLQEIAEK